MQGVMVESESNTTVNGYAYIPFVQEGETHTNSIMIVRVSGTDTANRFLMDWQYKDYEFGTQTGGWSAERVFLLLANFDYEIFGHTHFLLTDDLLLADVYPALRPQDAAQYPGGRPVALALPGQSGRASVPITECTGGFIDIYTILIPSGNCTCEGGVCTD